MRIMMQRTSRSARCHRLMPGGVIGGSITAQSPLLNTPSSARFLK